MFDGCFFVVGRLLMIDRWPLSVAGGGCSCSVLMLLHLVCAQVLVEVRLHAIL